MIVWYRQLMNTAPDRIYRFVLSCALAAACSGSTAVALEPTNRQSEAIYSELAAYPAFKTADDALNTSYKQKLKSASAVAAAGIKERQRQWLKDMRTAVFNARPEERLRIAIRMTQERTLALLEDEKGIALQSRKAQEQQPPAASGREESLKKTSLGLGLSTSGGELTAFKSSLFAAIEQLEKETDQFFGEDDLPPALAERAGLLLVACNNYVQVEKGRAGTVDALNENDEKLALLHGLVIRNAPEKKNAAALQIEAYKRLVSKDFKGAADRYSKAIQLLEQMEFRLKTDRDVYTQFVKKSAPSSIFTDLASTQLQGADFAGAINTVMKAVAVDKRVSKEGSAWVGEAQLIAAKAQFKLKRYSEAEAAASESVRLLDSVEYGNLREAKTLLATIKKARRQ